MQTQEQCPSHPFLDKFNLGLGLSVQQRHPVVLIEITVVHNNNNMDSNMCTSVGFFLLPQGKNAIQEVSQGTQPAHGG